MARFQNRKAGVLSRRNVIASSLAMVAAGCAPALPPQPTPPPSLETRPPLRDLAAAHGLFYGAAAATPYLDRDVAFAAAYARESGVLVPEWEMKWAIIQPEPEVFDFSAGNRLLALAQERGMGFRGHNLIWHLYNPAWLRGALAGDDPRGVLETYVRRVVGQYRGAALAWDVVNEAVEPKDGRADGLRRSLWLEALGPGYIDLAFRVARAADPKAVLVYNDYGLDHADFESVVKRRAVLDLLRGLRDRAVPVDALGLQAHLWAGRPFDGAGLRRFIRDVAALGLDVQITELDVTDVDLPDDGTRDAIVARLTGDYLDAALAEPAVKGVITWGLSDKYSWLNTRSAPWGRRRDGKPERGLPLDDRIRRKPMWGAIADAFATRRLV
jgi:endo-1,4-beta-xylanase